MEINSIEEQIAWLVSQQATQKLASYTLGAISGESSKTVSKFDQQWLTFSRAALGLNQLEPGTGQLNVALKSNLLLPSLLVYSCKATGGELLPAFKGAVAWHFLIRASYLFDDIQDRDRPDSLVGQFGEGVALNLALILLEIGQQLEIEVLDEVFNPLYEASLEKASVIRIRKLHETIKQKLFQTISFAARGQLLDLQETSLETAELLDNLPYYLKKASLKSALIVSHITQLGAVISLAKPLSLSLEPEEVLKRIEGYKQFGFNFGIALHLINDLKEFLAGFASPHKNRDLTQANLTLPLLHSYQALSTQGRSQFLQLWTELRRAKAAQKEKVVTTVDSLPQIPELIELLRAEKVASIGVLETLANAYNFVAQAQACLAFDPYCVEHQTMLEFLQNLLKLIASTFKNLFEV